MVNFNVSEIIQELILNKTKENLRLKYIPNVKLKGKNEAVEVLISKAVCGMLNIGGGEIVLGGSVSRKQLVPNETKIDFLSEKIAGFLKFRISPEPENVFIEKVEINNTQFIYINVPESNSVPFMLDDYKFYKRIPGKEIPIEEYEIRMLYSQNRKSNIVLESIKNTEGIPQYDSGALVSFSFLPKIILQNIGNRIEKNYKLEVWIPSKLIAENFYSMHTAFNRFENEYSVYSKSGEIPLFEGEQLKLWEFKILVNHETLSVFEKSNLIVKIYSSEGNKLYEYNLLSKFKFKQKQINQYWQEKKLNKNAY